MAEEAAKTESRAKHHTLCAAQHAAVGLYSKEITSQMAEEFEPYASAQWGLLQHMRGEDKTRSVIGRKSCPEEHPGWCRNKDSDDMKDMDKVLAHLKRVLTQQGAGRFRTVLKLTGRLTNRPVYLFVVVTGGRDSPKQFAFNLVKPMGDMQCVSAEPGWTRHLSIASYLMRVNQCRLPMHVELSEYDAEWGGKTYTLPTDTSQWQLVKDLKSTGHPLTDWGVVLLEELPQSRNTTKLVKQLTDYGTASRSRIPAASRPAAGQTARSAFEQGMKLAMRSVATAGLDMKLQELFNEAPDDDNDLLIQHYLEVGVDIAAGDMIEKA